MKSVETDIISALQQGRDRRCSPHDYVAKNFFLNHMIYVLWKTTIVRLTPTTIELGTKGGAFQTTTTKSRINAIARAFSLPGITQHNFIWTWTDGVPYDGVRTFPRT